MTNKQELEQLKDAPTLLFQRLCYFLDEDTALRVIAELGQLCPHCWDSELPCHCENDE